MTSQNRRTWRVTSGPRAGRLPTAAGSASSPHSFRLPAPRLAGRHTGVTIEEGAGTGVTSQNRRTWRAVSGSLAGRLPTAAGLATGRPRRGSEREGSRTLSVFPHSFRAPAPRLAGGHAGVRIGKGAGTGVTWQNRRSWRAASGQRAGRLPTAAGSATGRPRRGAGRAGQERGGRGFPHSFRVPAPRLAGGHAGVRIGKGAGAERLKRRGTRRYRSRSGGGG